ncbi:MAG TPA: glycerophosphodiester phosphodiesterase family protein [Bacteroidota bacterium]|nr:glycerophosphodiester phosphodiesterase family protein [Bacteroidota bacterium]
MPQARKHLQKFSAGNIPLIIAHRGYSELAPENSMAAFHRAYEARVDMIELDVRLSSDNEFVVFHDRKLNRTSEGRGAVKNFSSGELTAIDNGSWFSRRFSHERIPLLRDVLPMTKKGMLINIEIKPDVDGRDDFSLEEEIVRLVARARAAHRVMFSSFNHFMMKAIKRIDSSIVTGILYNPIADFRHSPSQLAARAHADIFICSKYQINSDVVQDAHDSGCLVYVYGVRSERDVRRMISRQVDGIIADDPGMVKKHCASLLQ